MYVLNLKIKNENVKNIEEILNNQFMCHYNVSVDHINNYYLIKLNSRSEKVMICFTPVQRGNDVSVSTVIGPVTQTLLENPFSNIVQDSKKKLVKKIRGFILDTFKVSIEDQNQKCKIEILEDSPVDCEYIIH